MRWRYSERYEDEAVCKAGMVAERVFQQRAVPAPSLGSDDAELTRKSHEVSLRFESGLKKIQGGGNMRKCKKCGTFLGKNGGVSGTWKGERAEYCHKCRPSGPCDKVDQVGSHAASLTDVTPKTERGLVDRTVPTDLTGRWVAEAQTRVATLQLLLQTAGPNTDRAAIQAQIETLNAQIAIRTSSAAPKVVKPGTAVP